jgi:hypothetical protein
MAGLVLAASSGPRRNLAAGSACRRRAGEWPFACPVVGLTVDIAEMVETDPWAVNALLAAEILTPRVLDPCAGRGILAEAARVLGHEVQALDAFDWGYPARRGDFLALSSIADIDPDWRGRDFTVLMNPPFSLAEGFVRQALALGARKIVCFERLAWWESGRRRRFWNAHPPQRIHLCAERATCWRLDKPPSSRKDGRTPTAHAWFVWERGQPSGPLLGRLYRNDIPVATPDGDRLAAGGSPCADS